MKRRDFLKLTSSFLFLGLIGKTFGIKSAVAAAGSASAKQKLSDSQKATVYFSRDISSEALIKLYDKISQNIGGKVAIKWHSGEPHGPNIIPRDMVKALQEHIPNSSLVETNTLYVGARQTTQQHRETLKINGWDFCKVDIMDEDGAVMLPIKNGKHFKEMSVGKHMLDYDSMVVLTHFKGHAMGGFGGSMKNIAIGCADGPVGKKMVHEAPDDHDYSKWRSGARFMENMADSAKATVDYFSPRIVYINVLRNMSVDCDCAGVDAAPPKTRNIGILASTDLLAIDKASIDLVYQLPENELHDLKERIESREGLHQLTAMKELGLGTDVYELVEV